MMEIFSNNRNDDLLDFLIGLALIPVGIGMFYIFTVNPYLSGVQKVIALGCCVGVSLSGFMISSEVVNTQNIIR